MFGRKGVNFNINAPQPNIIQRAVQFEPIKLDAALFFKVIFGAIALFAAWWFLKDKLTWLFAKKVHYPDIPTFAGGGDVTVGFLAQVPTYVQTIQAALKQDVFQTTFNQPLCSMFQRLTTLKPNELITVVNTYNKNNLIDFKRAISDTKSGCGFGDDYKEKLLYKFKQFNI